MLKTRVYKNLCAYLFPNTKSFGINCFIHFFTKIYIPKLYMLIFVFSPTQFFFFMKMNEIPMTCSTLNVKSQQKCKAKKNVKNTFHSNECSFIEQREKHQKHKKHKNTADDISSEGMILYLVNMERLLKI